MGLAVSNNKILLTMNIPLEIHSEFIVIHFVQIQWKLNLVYRKRVLSVLEECFMPFLHRAVGHKVRHCWNCPETAATWANVSVAQNLINLLFAQKVLPINYVVLGAELPEINLLRHPTYHVLFLRHFNIQTLLFYLHRCVLNLLQIWLEKSLENFNLNFC